MKNNIKRVCDAFGCNKSQSKHISLHKLPENKIEKQKWIEILQIKNQNKKLFACSRHFSPSDFKCNSYKGKIRRLKKDAYPSSCLLGSSIETKPLDLKKLEDIIYSHEDLSQMVSHDHTYMQMFCTTPKIIAKRRPPPKRYNRNRKFIKPKMSFPNFKSNTDCMAESLKNNNNIKSNKRLRKLPLKLRDYAPVPIICLKKASPKKFNQTQYNVVEEVIPLPHHFYHPFEFVSINQNYNVSATLVESKPMKTFVNVGVQCNQS